MAKFARVVVPHCPHHVVQRGMRRLANVSLQYVARRVGMSPARISEIQMKIELGNMSMKGVAMLMDYELKDWPVVLLSIYR